MSRIRLVCFDLGGVLLRICRSWREGCERVGLEVRGDVDAVFATTGWDELNDVYQRGGITGRDFAERLSDLVEGIYEPDEILRVHEAWVIGEYDGVADVITRLREAGLETAVLSNTCHEHWIEFDRFPTLGLVPNVVASHLIAARKPDRAAYEAVQARTGRRAGEILFFDDTQENVDGARRMGWHAESIDPEGATATQLLDHLVTHAVLER